jgi:hypothetical protein
MPIQIRENSEQIWIQIIIKNLLIQISTVSLFLLYFVYAQLLPGAQQVYHRRQREAHQEEEAALLGLPRESQGLQKNKGIWTLTYLILVD